MNKEYYDYRTVRLRRMKRIREESDLFADRHKHFGWTVRLPSFIVSSIHYYYLQQRQD